MNACRTLVTNGARSRDLLLAAGDNTYMELGNGLAQAATPETRYVAVQVASDISFAQVCTGDRHSCALEPAGKAWCWGEQGLG